jgi:hypothetical protein
LSLQKGEPSWQWDIVKLRCCAQSYPKETRGVRAVCKQTRSLSTASTPTCSSTDQAGHRGRNCSIRGKNDSAKYARTSREKTGLGLFNGIHELGRKPLQAEVSIIELDVVLNVQDTAALWSEVLITCSAPANVNMSPSNDSTAALLRTT